MGLNIVPIKYSSDIHTPKHNYDVINIADVTVTVYDVPIFTLLPCLNIDSDFCSEKMPCITYVLMPLGTQSKCDITK